MLQIQKYNKYKYIFNKVTKQFLMLRLKAVDDVRFRVGGSSFHNTAAL